MKVHRIINVSTPWDKSQKFTFSCARMPHILLRFFSFTFLRNSPFELLPNNYYNVHCRNFTKAEHYLLPVSVLLCKMMSVIVGQMIKFLLLKQLFLSISRHNNLTLSVIMVAHHCSRLDKRYPLNTDKRHVTRTNKTNCKETRQRKTYKFLFKKDEMSLRGIRIPFVINICMLRDRHKHVVCEETRRVDKLGGKKTEQSERMRGGIIDGDVRMCIIVRVFCLNFCL